MSKFRLSLLNYRFAANAKVTSLLKGTKSTDLELATAVKSTKAYKDSKDLQTEVAIIIAGKPTPAQEPEKSKSKADGEPPRRY